MKRPNGLARLVLVLGLASCQPKAQSAATDANAAAAEPKPEPDAAVVADLPPLPPGTAVSFERELGLVEQVRELKATQPVRGFRIAEADLLTHLKGSFTREVPPHALAGTQEMLRLLGVVPLDFDYEQTVLGLLRQQLAGLYDPRLDALFVRDHLEGAELEATLYHELVHALQDQAYRLDDFSAWKEDGTDRASALSALAEGDAMSAMYDSLFAVLAERTGAKKKTSLDLSTAELLAGMDAASDVEGDDGVPAIVRRSLIAPYRDGLLFVQALRRRGGWALVNGGFEHPPASTEQVLHVERYLAREAPVEVPVLSPPGTGWKKTLSDVWGEQSVRLLFEEWHGRTQAAEGAAGWGGDRIAVFSRGEERILTWHLVLDDEAAAIRHFRTFAREAKTKEDGFCLPRADRGPFVAARRGNHVIVLAGPGGSQTPVQDSCAAGLAWARERTAALTAH